MRVRGESVLYGGAVFVGALLLFLVQPMVARVLLPVFGGSAGVWTTCMLFFQAVLLAGYAYAHWSTRYLRPRLQAALHIGLLAVSLALLPLAPVPGNATGDRPVIQILALLAGSVGLPFFLLSATSPLAQAWYARQGWFPYRLFAFSNLASLVALLAYPVVLEPAASTHFQLAGWSAGYAGFVVLCGAAALASRRPGKALASAEWPALAPALLWIGLAACASTLWLAVANQLSQNVAPIPLLWVLPLSVYLLSFILCFEGRRWYDPALYRYLMPAGWLMVYLGFSRRSASGGLLLNLVLLLAGLFLCCMFCHGELARRKPEPAGLTGFYVLVALGGALGGLFVALLAPVLFSDFHELAWGLVACIILALALLYGRRSPRVLIRLSLVVVLAFVAAVRFGQPGAQTAFRGRNFYGALQVLDTGEGDSAIRWLNNGHIEHGAQYLARDRSRTPILYYGPRSGVALALRYTRSSAQRVGVIGLGSGTLAAYGQPGDVYRFYELSPLVIRVAHEQFRYLRESRARIEIVPGDARLALQREPGERFDVLVVDAFSGDSIPVHLLTREAFTLYFQRLKPGGVLVFHVTNRYVDLLPVVKTAAAALGQPVRLVVNPPDYPDHIYAAEWVLLGGTPAFWQQLGGAAVLLDNVRSVRLWTDDYSNLFRLLR